MSRHSQLAIAALGAVVLSACSTATTQHYFDRFADVGNLTDPRMVVDESADGARVTLKQGNALMVHLPAQPDQGYRWELQPLANRDVVALLPLDYMPASGPATLPRIAPYGGWLAKYNPPGMPTGPGAIDRPGSMPVVAEGDLVLRLRGIAPGTATLQLDYKRPDQPSAPPAKTIRFEVAVIPATR